MITARLKSRPLPFVPQYLGPMNNSLATHNKPPPLSPDQMSRLLVTAHNILEQVTCPSAHYSSLHAYLPPHSLHPQVFVKF